MILRAIKVLAAIIAWIVAAYFIGELMIKKNPETNMVLGLIMAPLLAAGIALVCLIIFAWIIVPIINYITGKDCFNGKFTDDMTTVFGDD